MQFLLSGYGGTKQGLGFEEIDEVRIVLPPRDEQREISEFCGVQRNANHRLRSPVEKSVHGLTEYRSALITAAVTGQIAELR